MKESKAVTRRLIAQSIKPLVDELDEEIRRKGTPKERAMLAEVHALMDQLLGKGMADGAKPAAGVKGRTGMRAAGRSDDRATKVKKHIKRIR